MNARSFSRFLLIVALGLVIAFAPGPTTSLAGEGGTIPPNPTALFGSEPASLEFGAAMYALTLIY